MGKVRPKQDEVRFHCQDGCGHIWEAAPDRVLDCEDDFHPWHYEAECPHCGATAEQDERQRTMFKMWANATGPRTPQGKAASAANLEGHPTPEETRRTRFNALKTGIHAEVATYWPANPGKYDACEGCQYRNNQCIEQAIRGGPCLARTDLYFQNHLAFEKKDPELLRSFHGRLQAHIASIIESMVLSIARRGVEIEAPQWYYDKDGGFHLAEYTDNEGNRRLLTEVRAHPLLNTLVDYLKKNAMTLADAGMTLRQQDDDALLEGYIDAKQVERETEHEMRERQTRALEKLGDVLEHARGDREEDPILAEHRRLESPNG